MEILANIKETFAKNLRVLRGDRTQPEMAEFLDVPFRSYQNMESGEFMPTHSTVAQLAERLKINETRLFLDPELTMPTVKQALDMIRRDLDRLAAFSPAQRALFEALPAVDDDQARRFIGLIEERKSTLARNVAAPKKRDQG